MTTELVVTAIARSRRQVATDLLSLTKPRVVVMILVTTLVGYYVGVSGTPDYVRMLHLVVGTLLAAGGALALNQYWERDVDARMERTRARPLPDGRLSPLEALAFGAAIALLGVGYLAAFVNGLSAVVTLATLVLYLFAYTPLKLRTALCSSAPASPCSVRCRPGSRRARPRAACSLPRCSICRPCWPCWRSTRHERRCARRQESPGRPHPARRHGCPRPGRPARGNPMVAPALEAPPSVRGHTNGRLPPPRPPTGGGDDHDDEPSPRRPVMENALLATLFLIGGEVMLFAGLVSAFWVLRVSAPAWPPPLQPRLPVGVTGANTVVLLGSSVVIRMASRALERGDR